MDNPRVCWGKEARKNSTGENGGRGEIVKTGRIRIDGDRNIPRCSVQGLRARRFRCEEKITD